MEKSDKQWIGMPTKSTKQRYWADVTKQKQQKRNEYKMNINVNKEIHAKAQNEMKSVERGSTLTIYIKRCTLVNWRAATPCEHRLAITLLCRRIIGRWVRRRRRGALSRACHMRASLFLYNGCLCSNCKFTALICNFDLNHLRAHTHTYKYLHFSNKQLHLRRPQ